MQLAEIPFGITEWGQVEQTEHPGATGMAYWRTQHFGSIRVRMVEYTAGYVADHWCSKGHIILCMEGEIDTELDDGRIMNLKAGMTYFVGDNCEAHRTSSKNGCKLFIVD